MSEAPTLTLPTPTSPRGGDLARDAVPVLELDQVTKSYGADPPVHALAGVSFRVHVG